MTCLFLIQVTLPGDANKLSFPIHFLQACKVFPPHVVGETIRVHTNVEVMLVSTQGLYPF